MLLALIEYCLHFTSAAIAAEAAASIREGEGEPLLEKKTPFQLSLIFFRYWDIVGWGIDSQFHLVRKENEMLVWSAGIQASDPGARAQG